MWDFSLLKTDKEEIAERLLTFWKENGKVNNILGRHLSAYLPAQAAPCDAEAVVAC